VRGPPEQGVIPIVTALPDTADHIDLTDTAVVGTLDFLAAAADAPPPRKPNVLVVDDQPANLLALEAILGDLDVNIVKANSGNEALRCLLAEDFAVILMDVRMPGMDGFEAAELIRRRKRSRDTPIIFLTGVESADDQVFKGYSLGAVDYLLKPVAPHMLRSKVSVFVDIFRKTEQIKQQAGLLRRWEQREHERELTEAKARWESERLHQEIRIARQIQQKLFPVAPLPIPGLEVAGGSFPAEATGGDYFDYIPMQDGDLAVVIGDVCGHGFGPALVMAQLRAYLRAFLLTRTDVGEVVGLLNRTLTDDTDRFVTLFVAKINPRTRAIVYSGAGHLPGYVIGTDGRVKARLESSGVPLAITHEAEFATATAPPLEPGELLLLFTDGIVEAHGPGQDLLGTIRVLDLVRANRHRPAREIVHSVYDAARDYCGTDAPDDMTAIVIKAGE